MPAADRARYKTREMPEIRNTIGARDARNRDKRQRDFPRQFRFRVSRPAFSTRAQHAATADAAINRRQAALSSPSYTKVIASPPSQRPWSVWTICGRAGVGYIHDHAVLSPPPQHSSFLFVPRRQRRHAAPKVASRVPPSPSECSSTSARVNVHSPQPSQSYIVAAANISSSQTQLPPRSTTLPPPPFTAVFHDPAIRAPHHPTIGPSPLHNTEAWRSANAYPSSWEPSIPPRR
jgi:hypothetical protein